MPKVSVILPNYNHAPFLKQRIESIIHQSYQDFEMIILDDLSTDRSREVIEAYRNHPKVAQIVFNKKNSGSTFKQWERGIQLARGEYIWIAESDDWCEYTLLEELVSGLSSHENCVISYCQSYCIQDSNIINWQSQHPYLEEIINGYTFIKKYMVKNNTIFNASMVLWKKDLFESVPKDFTNYKFCGDWLFWIEIARLGDVYISGKLLNYFRKHEHDVSGKYTKNGLNYIETLDILNFLFKEQLINDFEYAQTFKSLFKMYYREKNTFDLETARKIQNLFKNPVSIKVAYLKVLLSAVWQKLKSGS